jgi:hypothetical protein
VSLTFASTGAYNLTLQSDNTSTQAISFAVAATNTADGLSAVVSAINDQSSKTGVTASLNSTGTAVVLTNATGNDIAVHLEVLVLPRGRLSHDFIDVLVVLHALAERRVHEDAECGQQHEGCDAYLCGFVAHK